jgi:hypothetical protein
MSSEHLYVKVVHITDKVHGVQLPPIKPVPQLLSVRQLKWTLLKMLKAEAENPASVGAGNWSFKPIGKMRLHFLHNGVILDDDEEVPQLPAKNEWVASRNSGGFCWENQRIIDLSMYVENAPSSYRDRMESIAIQQQKYAEKLQKDDPLNRFQKMTDEGRVAPLPRPRLNLARAPFAFGRNARANVAPPAAAGAAAANNAGRRAWVFRFNLDMNWIIRALIFGMFLLTEPNFGFVGLFVLAVYVIKMIYAWWHGGEQPQVIGQNNAPAGAQGAAAPGAAPAAQSPPVRRASYLPARGHGTFGFVVEVERFIYGFFASLFPSWQPEEVPAAGEAAEQAPANAPQVQPPAEPVNNNNQNDQQEQPVQPQPEPQPDAQPQAPEIPVN